MAFCAAYTDIHLSVALLIGIGSSRVSLGAGVHNIGNASDLYYQCVMSPSSGQDHASVTVEYVRLREMVAARDSLSLLDRDWTFALQQPQSVGELLLKASCCESCI